MIKIELKGEKPVFSGRAVFQELYRTGTSILMNADMNGAVTILHK